MTLCSLGLALLLSLFITFYIYANGGFAPLTQEIYVALFDIVKFWFPLTWSFTLLIALFRSLKYIFNIEISGYKLRLLDCQSKEALQDIGYGDLVKVWRKWFMVMIWLVGAQMLLCLFFTYLFTSYTGVFEWFSIYFLFGFILIAGYFSFVLLGGRCKKVKLVKC
ncbi:MAG: hypothetical protein Q9M43_00315 [Sulfurimonas sp.]|nr:hypothetical protein [Sulfurimonas sp.]